MQGDMRDSKMAIACDESASFTWPLDAQYNFTLKTSWQLLTGVRIQT